MWGNGETGDADAFLKESLAKNFKSGVLLLVKCKGSGITSDWVCLPRGVI